MTNELHEVIENYRNIVNRIMSLLLEEERKAREAGTLEHRDRISKLMNDVRKIVQGVDTAESLRLPGNDKPAPGRFKGQLTTKVNFHRPNLYSVTVKEWNGHMWVLGGSEFMSNKTFKTLEKAARYHGQVIGKSAELELLNRVDTCLKDLVDG